MNKLLRFALIFALALLLQLVTLPKNTLAAETILTGKILATVMRAAPMPFNAIVDEVCVKPGDPVKRNQPLLRFHLQSEAERILQKEITLGSNTEDLRGKILDLERERGLLEAQFNKNRQLVASNLGSRQALRRQENELRALGERATLLRKTIKKAQDSFAARLRELERYYTVPLTEGAMLPSGSLILPAPIDGYVLSVESVFPGTMLKQGDMPVVVGPLDPLLIQVPVYEGELKDIHEGAMARVEIPSLGNKKFEARVAEISWVSTDMNVAKPSYFTIKLMIKNPNLEIKPGFKAVVRF